MLGSTVADSKISSVIDILVWCKIFTVFADSSVTTKELENFSRKKRMVSDLLRYILAYGHEKSSVRTLEAMHVPLHQVVDRCHSKLVPHETTAHNEQNNINMSTGSYLLSFG